jgi:hypothetical protein
VTHETEWEISGIVDWDNCEVAPIEIAYTCPVWVWSDFSIGSSFDEQDWDPDTPVFNEECEIKAAFEDEIETLLPGFMDTVRRVRRGPLKRLWKLAGKGMHSNEDAKIAKEIIARSTKLDDD